jgi:hypothetical protein
MKLPSKLSAKVTLTPIAQGVQGKVLTVAVAGELARGLMKNS